MNPGRTIAALAVLLVLAPCPPAAAQSPPDRGYIAVRAGINRENAEDGLRGTSAAGGFALGLTLGPRWSAEIEVWVPGAIEDAEGEPKHRDLPVSASLVRFFDAGPTRPYLVGGISIARTESYMTTCIADRAVPTIVSCDEPDVRQRTREKFTTSSGYLVLGTGVELPLGGRVRVAPEVRVLLAATSIILRPGVAMIVRF